MSMKKSIAVSMFILAMALQGCSAFKSATETVFIQCNEPETMLSVSGESQPCPAQIQAKRNRSLSIQAEKSGYSPYLRIIDYQISTTGAFDVIGALLFYLPAIGLLTPGAWDLEETDILIQLTPLPTQSLHSSVHERTLSLTESTN